MAAQNGYDFIIVGAGSAGCVLASRLSEDASVTVLILESGPVDDTPDLDVPIRAPRFLKSSIDWDDRSDPEPGLAGRRMNLAHGRVIGGSSSINSMVYLRGACSDYDEWSASGATGWSYAEVLPYFRRAEDNDRGPDRYHGSGGPLSVSDGRSRHPLSAAFVEAAREAGYPYNHDLNGTTQEGVSFTQTTQRNGRRCSTATAYLRPSLARPNLTLAVGTDVVELLFDGSRVVGVAARQGSDLRHFRADREVILCAGTYRSPQLLMLAGIGPQAHLGELGIRTRVDLPVGQGLQDHLRGGIVYRTHLSSLADAVTDEAIARFEQDGTGPVSSHVGETSGFIRSRPELEAPDLQVNGVPSRVGDMLSIAGQGVSIIGWPAKPTSRGDVTLHSVDPSVKPRIRHNYLTSAEDQRVTCDGIRRMLEIAAQPAFKAVAAGEPISIPPADTDEAILKWIRPLAATTHHPTSTCGIGAVVDAELRVLGVPGLRVADASVMPSVTRGNTNAPTIMIGEKAADLVLDRAPLPRADLNE